MGKLQQLFKPILTLLGGLLAIDGAIAQTQELNPVMREQVVMVKKGEGLLSTQLETTLFKPPGEGPFPVAIVNHGKAPGNPLFQQRARYELQSLELLKRGYLVAVPMRQGFSKSTGSYIGGGCNTESNGRVQAEDVLTVMGYLKTLPEADVSRIIVLGQSHGGLTTMALGASNPPGVRGLVNFAGGLKNESCSSWELGLVDAFRDYGKQGKLPSLWFYGDNDSYWPVWLYKRMHQAYVDAGGQARLVAYGEFGSDAHGMFGSRRGLAVWTGEVDRFLASLNMPHEVVHKLTGKTHATAIPPSSGFAALEDDKALPHVKQTGKEGYLKFLNADPPKAFAISPTGAWAYSSNRPEAITSAIGRCNEFAKAPVCKLYAVDEAVVWVKD